MAEQYVDIDWALSTEKRSCSLRFQKPELENLYHTIRSHRFLNVVPRILIIIVWACITLRRVQLVILSFYGGTTSMPENEVRLLIIISIALIVETLTYVFDRFSYFRCTSLVLICFYTAADGSITYYHERVRDEPVYAFTSFQIAAATPVVCFMLCRSWVYPFMAHILGQGIIIFYTQYYYAINTCKLLLVLIGTLRRCTFNYS